MLGTSMEKSSRRHNSMNMQMAVPQEELRLQDRMEVLEPVALVQVQAHRLPHAQAQALHQLKVRL